MEKFKLISMTDFVLEQSDNAPIIKKDMVNDILISRFLKYAQLLKQPLKLEMFVPCDDNGNVLKYPVKDGIIESHESLKKYEQAKEKVLFDWFNDIEAINYHISRNRTIEYLSKFGSIELTQNAIKQFL